MLRREGVGLHLDPVTAAPAPLRSPVGTASPAEGNVARGLASAIVLSVPLWVVLVAMVLMLLG